MVIRALELGESASAISKLPDIPQEIIDVRNAHQYKAGKKHDVLERIPKDYLRAKFGLHRQELMESFFHSALCLEFNWRP
jgi:hypothetical protein